MLCLISWRKPSLHLLDTTTQHFTKHLCILVHFLAESSLQSGLCVFFLLLLFVCFSYSGSISFIQLKCLEKGMHLLVGHSPSSPSCPSRPTLQTLACDSSPRATGWPRIGPLVFGKVMRDTSGCPAQLCAPGLSAPLLPQKRPLGKWGLQGTEEGVGKWGGCSRSQGGRTGSRGDGTVWRPRH